MIRSFDDVWSNAVTALRVGRGRRVRGGGARREPVQLLELWDLEACPFSRTVREALSELDLEYVCHPVARGSAHRDATPTWADGRKSYPHLVDADAGVSMKESRDIVEHLHETYGSGRVDGPLAPLHTALSFAASALRPLALTARPAHARRRGPEAMLVLYQFEGCPYCRNVREKLAVLNLDHHVKSAARRSRRREELARIGGRAKVPFLIDANTGRSLYESDAICAYLEDEYGRKSDVT